MNGRDGWKYEQLEQELGFSKSVIHRSLSRCSKARFISANPFDYFFTENLKEFLLHGIQYAFAIEPGKVTRGVFTAHSAPVLNKQIISDKEQYVWPYSKGTARGQSIEPLDKRVPEIAAKDADMYELLALIDAVRVGQVREKELASRILSDKLDYYALNYQQVNVDNRR